ncbi:MAG: GTP-binding protein [Candidatus Thermoplasmatota archaeon]|nr:GTP-binding protein [Candidatus Thermoplasmatota archaeon]
MAQTSKKILLLGDGAVGKTSLVRRFVEQRFKDEYIATIGVNVKKKSLPDLDVKLMLWDMYGQKMNKDLHSSHYSGADGAIIVYDLTRYDTFLSLASWINEVFSVTGKIPFVILGNKLDLIEKYENSGYDDFESFIQKEQEDVIEFYEEVYDEVPDFSRVSLEDQCKWAEDKKYEIDSDFSYYFTSAKTGENVEKAFRKIGELSSERDIE